MVKKRKKLKRKPKRARRKHKPTPRPQPAPKPVPPSGQPIPTTLAEIKTGKFRTATNKQGANGTLVTVSNLKVLYTKPQADGDVHVAVTDGVESMICEIIPQRPLPTPADGAVITITGYAYSDTVHQNEAWHYNSAWQLHPLVSIVVESTPATPSAPAVV
jgi:hypothetical protein